MNVTFRYLLNSDVVQSHWSTLHFKWQESVKLVWNSLLCDGRECRIRTCTCILAFHVTVTRLGRIVCSRGLAYLTVLRLDFSLRSSVSVTYYYEGCLWQAALRFWSNFVFTTIASNLAIWLANLSLSVRDNAARVNLSRNASFSSRVGKSVI